MTGDAVEISTDATIVKMSGRITCQGILRDGCGLVELTLPDADPQQRRALAGSKSYSYDLYRGGALLYSSPLLTLRETRRAGDGALVVTGAP
ncbi:hypothetical protein OG756_34570 [Streptomyces sp. NBC_01310]|uniref:hypothetical protein n=1 Tax=Streptomyces sp. NBC_01310 TaxID=2903820 RepID=UPI0035B5BBD0|nr:hypothetical protein OG756_34570 [Streptomyces sp. NBC_01310]